jgi:hypothetical protein
VPFDPAELNTVAHALVACGTDEANLRTAIGQLYYAAHLMAREGLRTKGWEPTGRGKDHGLVIAKLAQHNLRVQSDQLSHLKELREHADYHLEPTESALNQGCKQCRNIRRVGPAGNLVTIADWQEAADTSSRLFPKLLKL